MTTEPVPSVLFVCVHNAGRSQMAAGLLTALAGKRYEDWHLDDPAGQPLDTVRAIRDQIERRVRDLIAQLT